MPKRCAVSISRHFGAHGVDLLVFPELAVCGYPPEDLLLKKHFLKGSRLTVEKLAADCPEGTIIVGFAESHQDDCYNSAAVLQNGRITQNLSKGASAQLRRVR